MSTPDRSVEQDGKPSLFISKHGLRVLRQLTPTELGRQPIELISTPEGLS